MPPVQSPPTPPSAPKNKTIREGYAPVPEKQGRPAPVSAKQIFDEMETRGYDLGSALIQSLTNKDSVFGSFGNISRGWLIAIAVITGAFTLVMLIGTIWVTTTINRMNNSYTQQVNQIIMTKSQMESTSSWERLPVGQKKEKLREQYYSIVRYYTNNSPLDQKMSDEQILQSFNTLWLATERVTTVNFFFPVAFIKSMTNFNPYFNRDDRIGMAYFYLKNAEQIANLKLIRDDPIFMLDYKGTGSLNNPVDSIKLLVARIDDLSKTFNGREDWIFLALITNEYEVISKYWNNGAGMIPDELYLKGPLAECLRYYHSFKNWEIPQK